MFPFGKVKKESTEGGDEDGANNEDSEGRDNASASTVSRKKRKRLKDRGEMLRGKAAIAAKLRSEQQVREQGEGKGKEKADNQHEETADEMPQETHDVQQYSFPEVEAMRERALAAKDIQQQRKRKAGDLVALQKRKWAAAQTDAEGYHPRT